MDLSWMDRAACVGMDPDLFFPSKGRPDLENKAKKVCAGCPVRTQCLDTALQYGHNANTGIWGGTSGRERTKIKRQRRVGA